MVAEDKTNRAESFRSPSRSGRSTRNGSSIPGRGVASGTDGAVYVGTSAGGVGVGVGEREREGSGPSSVMISCASMSVSDVLLVPEGCCEPLRGSEREKENTVVNSI